MTPLHVHDVVAFVPTRDFAKSRAFYLELGFKRMLTAMAIFRDQAQAVATGLVAEK
jgi:predicted lactoylglutathione lyase